MFDSKPLLFVNHQQTNILKLTSGETRRCVPTTTSTLPSASPASTRFCSAAVRNRLRSSMLTGYSLMRSRSV